MYTYVIKTLIHVSTEMLNVSVHVDIDKPRPNLAGNKVVLKFLTSSEIAKSVFIDEVWHDKDSIKAETRKSEWEIAQI